MLNVGPEHSKSQNTIIQMQGLELCATVVSSNHLFNYFERVKNWVVPFGINSEIPTKIFKSQTPCHQVNILKAT